MEKSKISFVVKEIPEEKTICFATMCKDEEHCIKETLESIYTYIDTWVVHDTGSTDNTCQIITDFFEEKGIPGELFIDEWKGFDHNKTLLFNKCYKKSDYILHIDADDIIVGDLQFNTKSNADAYYLNTKRGTSNFKCLVLWNNNVHWKFCGVAHTTIKCLDKSNFTKSEELVCDDVYLHSRDTGSRGLDPDKYYKDALRLKDQFFDTLYEDPDYLNTRSVFYTAQSYMDAKQNEDALKWYSLYLKLNNTWIEEQYEANLRIARLLIRLEKSYDEIKLAIDRAIDIFPDRAEAYFILGKHCNYIDRSEIAYQNLTKAFNCDYDAVKKKYILFVSKTSYNKYVLDELSLACYWTQRYEEGKKYLLKIINDEEFKEHKKRYNQNMIFFNKNIIQLINDNNYLTITGGLELSNKFLNNKPFNYVVIDDFINKKFLENVENEIRNGKYKDDFKYANVRGIKPSPSVNKYVLEDSNKHGKLTKQLIKYLNSEKIINWLKYITNIKELLPDNFTMGGGVHLVKKGGYLNIHADFNMHLKTKKYRRLNLLLYINSNYKEEYNGHLELWNKEMTKCEKKIAPIFNRIVIFRVNDDAYHGHREPWMGPDGKGRLALAMYYYTNDRPEHEKSTTTCAQWQTPKNISPTKI